MRQLRFTQPRLMCQLRFTLRGSYGSHSSNYNLLTVARTAGLFINHIGIYQRGQIVDHPACIVDSWCTLIVSIITYLKIMHCEP